ncbi:hypothetical protein T484DRAFT_1763135 [Baffinella frigidus]|nr:hypothetical protein T484DRAFT_1763135 [Cryptophyta sp. CCMP2293]
MEAEWGRPGSKHQKRAIFSLAGGSLAEKELDDILTMEEEWGRPGAKKQKRAMFDAADKVHAWGLELSASEAGPSGPLNDFGLWNEEGECMGRCVAPVVALVNHSCVPNCAQVVTSLVTSLVTPGGRFEEFPVREAHVRLVALRDIEAGEELSQCYVNLLDADRAAVIQRSWRYRCRCAH